MNIIHTCKVNSKNSLLFLAFLLLTALSVTPVRAQALKDRNITLRVQNETVENVFNKLSQLTHFKFFYDQEVVGNAPRISLDVKNADLTQVLNQITSQSKLYFNKTDRTISVSRQKVVETIQQKQKSKTISGVVVDESGEPIIGASVLVKGSANGTITNLEGHFSLKDTPENSTLIISYIGYKTLNMSAYDKRVAQIILVEDSKMIDEVVVVGYGTIKKANLSGAVDQISSKEIEHRVSGNAGQVLQGMIPNLNVTFSDGGINKKASFDVRGIGSINGGKPLILIDGVEGDMNYINPKDIETISVLKDASSAAIYGARASFGVVLITTKNPNEGKIKINYSNHFGWSSPTINTNGFITDGLEWARLSDKLSLLENTSTYLGYSEEDYAYMEARKKDPSLPSTLIKTVDGVERYVHYGNTDWWDYIFQNNQPSMEHNLSLSGGSDKVRFYLSGRFYTREGIYKINPDKLNSYTLRSKVDVKLSSKLKITNSTNIYFSDYTYPATNTRSVGGSDNSEDWRKYTFHASPVFMPRNPDGTIIINGAYSPGRDIADGTFADLTYGKSRGLDNEHDVSNTISLQFTPIKSVTLNTDYSFRKGSPMSQLLLISTPHTNQPGGQGITRYKPNTELYKEMHWSTMYQAFNAFATYGRTFNKNHDFKAMVGFNQEWRHWERSVARRGSPASEELGSFNLATGENVQVQGNAD